MNTTQEIVETRAAHRIDEKRLAEYLNQQLAEFSEELTIRQFAFGQSNPTYLLSTKGGEIGRAHV